MAVAIGRFLDQPMWMRTRHADLSAILRAVCRQGPAARGERLCGAPERRETDPRLYPPPVLSGKRVLPGWRSFADAFGRRVFVC